MSPEQLNNQEYSTKSDVFAFSVTCFEVVTRGGIPWGENVRPIEAASRVMNGEFLEIPEQAPEIVAKIMKKCFQMEPKDRPEFDEILALLSRDDSKVSLF